MAVREAVPLGELAQRRSTSRVETRGAVHTVRQELDCGCMRKCDDARTPSSLNFGLRRVVLKVFLLISVSFLVSSHRFPRRDSARSRSHRAPTLRPVMSVQMHPQACRHAVPASDFASSSSPPSPLASTPFFPPLETIFPTPSPSAPARHHHGRNNTHAPRSPPRDASSSGRPSHSGLQVDPNAYPLYSLSHHAPQIRVLSAAQYAELHERDSRAKLDEKELFPWSHGGADVPDSAAARYFGFAYGQAASTPK